jgi:hypothetical protein
VKLGKSVTAAGLVTPTSLAGSKVTLTAQLKKGAKWVKAKTFSATITSTGAYSWKYKPAKKGAYRMQAAITKTATRAAVTTKWLAFKVKQRARGEPIPRAKAPPGSSPAGLSFQMVRGCTEEVSGSIPLRSTTSTRRPATCRSLFPHRMCRPRPTPCRL